MTIFLANAEDLMAISLSNLTISTKAPVGTAIGTLALFNSSAGGVKANFILTKNSSGLFAISGANLVTVAASIAPGNYSVPVRAVGTTSWLSAKASFVITVTAT